MSVIGQGLVSGLQSVWIIARVVIPLMIILEIARQNAILDKMNRLVHPVFRYIGLSRDGAFPVLIATFFGLTFGSGVIIESINEGRLSPHEVKIIGGFIAINHALVEDTLIMAVLGVPVWILIAPRLAVAIAVSLILHHFVTFWHRKKRLQLQSR